MRSAGVIDSVHCTGIFLKQDDCRVWAFAIQSPVQGSYDNNGRGEETTENSIPPVWGVYSVFKGYIGQIREIQSPYIGGSEV